MVDIIIWTVVFLLCLTTYTPLFNTGFWWVRGWDFPRAQSLGISCVVLILLLYRGLTNVFEVAGCFILCGALLLDIYRIYRYLPLKIFQSLRTYAGGNAPKIKILTANVRQKNQQFKLLLDLVDQKGPDIVVVIEADQSWTDGLSKLKEKYPYSYLHPQNNTYGFLLFSKFELVNSEISFRTDPNVPSLRTQIMIEGQHPTNLYILHPRPPRPQEGESDQRDGELVQVAGEIQGVQGRFLVVGDLNDVAWSHTTRLFLRYSGLLDPRMGRGLFNTFHADFPFLRCPLDHVFCSDNFLMVAMERLTHIGSDHFPIYIEVALQDRPRHILGRLQGNEPEEVEEFKSRGASWDGPNSEVKE